MTTSSIQNASVTLTRLYETYAVHMTLTNDSGGDLKPGQAVYVNGDMTVDVADAAGDLPIGFVTVGGGDGEKVTVRTNFLQDIQGTAAVAAHAAGTLVRQNGTLESNGKPQFIVAASTEYAHGIVLNGAAAIGDPINVGMFRSPIVAP